VIATAARRAAPFFIEALCPGAGLGWHRWRGEGLAKPGTGVPD